jgi:uncharacterized membrane protein
MKRALFAVLAFFIAVVPARASLRLCDSTSYVLYAATAVGAADGVTVKGWTRIVPGACTIALQGDLVASAYYLYARTSQAYSGPAHAWAGTVDFCTKSDDFSLHVPFASPNCATPDMTALPFAAFSTHHMRSWTLTFREEPDFATMKDAEHAGLKRLLGDDGAANLRNDKDIDAALAQFEKRLHLSAKSGTEGLFDALETEALRNAAPIGYTVCNDTEKPVFAALGEVDTKGFVSRGWWMVAAASCAKTITDSIVGRKIYLRVERPKSMALVQGPMTFCVTDIEFEIHGREHCAARGLREAGFLATNTDGAAGFAAHISDKGVAFAVSKPK